MNERARHNTWHFTSVLIPTDQIRADINWIVTYNINVAHPHILLVKACIKEKVTHTRHWPLQTKPSRAAAAAEHRQNRRERPGCQSLPRTPLQQRLLRPCGRKKPRLAPPAGVVAAGEAQPAAPLVTTGSLPPKRAAPPPSLPSSDSVVDHSSSPVLQPPPSSPETPLLSIRRGW